MQLLTAFHQVMDELLPKATGKEARIEKKKIEREKKRARETSPGRYIIL